MPEDKSPDEIARALREAALKMAIEYHARSSSHPNSRGPARPVTVTSTAEEFLGFLREVADEAGVTPDDL